MPDLQWSEELETGVQVMDHDHQISVEQLQGLRQENDDREFTSQFVAFTDHLRAHFAREESLMDEHGFFNTQGHKMEHQRVLGDLGLIVKQAEAGDLSAVKRYVEREFSDWFVMHHATMDTDTAEFLGEAKE